MDGAYAHCTREELAGGLDPDAANTYAHRLNGPCRCGQQHGPRDRQEDGYIEEDGRRRLVKSIWAETRVDDGTVSAYLRSRGLSGEVPKTLHHHAWSPYYRDGKQILSAHDYHPAMVAAVQAADGRHVAIHRTYLAPNGVGKADVPEQKKSLGPITGAAVRLAKATDKLALTEGIETGLAVLEATGTPTWATLSAGGLKHVVLPESIVSVEIWADNDLNGVGQSAAAEVATRFRAEGRQVRVLVPAEADTDRLDVLNASGADALRAALDASNDGEPTKDAQAKALDAQPKEMSALGVNEHLSGPRVVRLADVQPERVRWLWRGRVPLGKLSLLDGDPGLGKSLVTLDIAARVSAGVPMPDGTLGDLQGPAGVVLLSAEDGLADTIRPRLDAAGADLTRIVALAAVRTEDGESLPTLADLPVFETVVTEAQAALVVIDPLMAFLPDELNVNRDHHIRRALAPLAALAEKTGAAMLVVRHLNKSSGGSPIYRGGGSIGIIGAARSALLVAKDPDDATEQRRIIAVSKGNLAAPVPALAYRLVDDGAGVRVRWEGATEHTAAMLVAMPAANEDRSAVDEALEFLEELLADGPCAADDVKRQAKQADISDATLRRAKGRRGVRVRKEGFGGGGRWVWELPKVLKNAKDAQPKVVSILGQDEHLCEECSGVLGEGEIRVCRGCFNSAA